MFSSTDQRFCECEIEEISRKIPWLMHKLALKEYEEVLKFIQFIRADIDAIEKCIVKSTNEV